MKKLFSIIAVCAIVLSLSLKANAQDFRFGIKAGINVSNVTGDIRNDFSKDVLKAYTGFHAGAVFNIAFGKFFAIQPELIYSQNGVRFDDKSLISALAQNVSVGSIQIPIGLQFGYRFGNLFRPFVTAVPYVGYAVSHGIKSDVITKEDLKDVWNKFDWGVGVGAGVDIWKFQVVAKYNWALGNLVKDIDNKFKDFTEDFQKSKIAGLEISVAFLF